MSSELCLASLRKCKQWFEEKLAELRSTNQIVCENVTSKSGTQMRSKRIFFIQVQDRSITRLEFITENCSSTRSFDYKTIQLQNLL